MGARRVCRFALGLALGPRRGAARRRVAHLSALGATRSTRSTRQHRQHSARRRTRRARVPKTYPNAFSPKSLAVSLAVRFACSHAPKLSRRAAFAATLCLPRRGGSIACARSLTCQANVLFISPPPFSVCVLLLARARFLLALLPHVVLLLGKKSKNNTQAKSSWSTFLTLPRRPRDHAVLAI